MNTALNSPQAEEELRPEHYQIRWLITGLAVILCITFFPYLFGGKTFLPFDMYDTVMSPFNATFSPPQAQNHYPIDGIFQGLPYKLQTKEALERGKLAYWNPHILGGYPEYAESLGNNFDIFNILLLWLDPLAAFHWETVLELFIAGIGMMLLLRFMGVSRVLNLLFATAYMLNSAFIAAAMHRCMIAAFCWVPFTVLMILRYFHSHQKEDLLFASFFLALVFLGGNQQLSFFAAIVILVIAFFSPSKRYPRNFRSSMAIFTGVVFLAFALSAVMWLPSLELLFQTIYKGGSLNSTTVYTSYSIIQRILSLPLLVHFFMPGLAGGPQIYSLKTIAGVDVTNFNGAIGFIPALFAFWGCFVFWKNADLRPFIILSLSALLLPIATPLYSILYHRFFIVASFALCVVGAVSFQLFMRNETVRRSFGTMLKWAAVLFGILCLGLVGICLYLALNYQAVYSKFFNYISPKIKDSAYGTGSESWMLGRVAKTLDYYSFFTPALWLPVIAAALSLGLLYYYRKGVLSQRNMLAGILAATLLQLLLYTRLWLPAVDTKQFPVFPGNAITAFLQRDTTGARFVSWRDGVKDPYILPSNSSNIYKTNDMHGYESCTNRSMSVFYKRHIHPDSLDLRLLGLENVKYVLTGSRVIASSNAKRVLSADGVSIYENLLCKPRAYIAYGTIIAESDSGVASELLSRNFDGSRAVFTRADAPPELRADHPAGQENIRFERSDNEEIVITARTDSKGIFILTDSYYPGWKCYINGIQKPIFRANHSMRGILLEPGTSQIVFRFEPDIFTAGISISAFTALLSIGGVLFLKFRKKYRANR